jgi:hypothetical protein
MPSFSMPMKSGVAAFNVPRHILGGFKKPAQIALKTDNYSSWPLYVLLLITIDGYMPLPNFFQYSISSSIIVLVVPFFDQSGDENELSTH